MKTIYITFVNYDDGKDYIIYKIYETKEEMNNDTATQLLKFFSINPDSITKLIKASINVPECTADLFINKTEYDKNYTAYVRKVYGTTDLKILESYTWNIVDFVMYTKQITKEEAEDLITYTEWELDPLLSNNEIMLNYIYSLLDEPSLPF